MKRILVAGLLTILLLLVAGCEPTGDDITAEFNDLTDEEEELFLEEDVGDSALVGESFYSKQYSKKFSSTKYKQLASKFKAFKKSSTRTYESCIDSDNGISPYVPGMVYLEYTFNGQEREFDYVDKYSESRGMLFERKCKEGFTPGQTTSPLGWELVECLHGSATTQMVSSLTGNTKNVDHCVCEADSECPSGLSCVDGMCQEDSLSDLTPGDLEAPSTVSAGKKFSLKFTVSNVGSVDAADSTPFAIHLTQCDGGLSTGCTVLKTLEVQRIQPGVTKFFDEEVTPVDPLVPMAGGPFEGQAHFTIHVDANEQIDELLETNNIQDFYVPIEAEDEPLCSVEINDPSNRLSDGDTPCNDRLNELELSISFPEIRECVAVYKGVPVIYDHRHGSANKKLNYLQVVNQPLGDIVTSIVQWDQRCPDIDHTGWNTASGAGGTPYLFPETLEQAKECIDAGTTMFNFYDERCS